MKTPVTFVIAAAAVFSSASAAVAGINSPDAAGYMTRGIAMYHDRNYGGCLDQLLQLRHLNPTEAQSEDALYYIAMSTLYCGDDEALALLTAFTERFGGSTRIPAVKAAIGDYHFTRGTYGPALTAYSETAPGALSGPQRDETLYRTAYCHMMLGENPAALAGFAEIAAGKGAYAEAARFYTAYIHYSQGNYDTALKEWEHVDTSVQPGAAAPYYMSQIYFLRGDYSRAYDMAAKVLGTGNVPQFTDEANRIAGESLFNLGKRPQALPYLWQYAAGASSPAPSAYYMLGVSEYDLGHYNEAVPLLQKAVNMPDALGQSACLYLGQCYIRRGDSDAALLMFERAYNMDCVSKVTETAFYNYIVARLDGGRAPFGRTVSMLEEFLQRYPGSEYAPTVRRLALDGYLTDRDYDSVLRLTSSPDALESDIARQARQQALYMTGIREYSANNHARALALFDEGASITRADAELSRQCRLKSAECLYDMGNYGKAKSSYAEYLSGASAADPNTALAYYGLGYAEYMLENYPEALDAFVQAAKTAATGNTRLKVDAFNRAGDCEYMQSQFSRARQYYNEAYAIDPAAGDYALYQQALMKGHMRDHTGKLALLEQVINRYPSSSLVPAAMLEQAEAYGAIGQDEQAIECYKELVRRYPSTTYGRNGYLQLAIAQMSAGARQSAIETYKKVIYTYPSSEEAKVAVDDLKRLYAEDGRLGELAAFVNSVPNAPHIETSELDASAFLAAETEYMDRGETALMREYIADYPHGAYQAQALYYMAENEADKGNSREALQYAAAVVLRHPDSEVAEDAMLLKAESEAAIGKYEVAYDTYAQLENRAAGARILQESRMGQLRTALRLKQWVEAITAADKLLSTTAAGSDVNGEVAFGRALALDRTGHHDEAENAWRQLAKDPGDQYGAMSAVHLAQSLLQRGRASEARTVVDAFINADPPQQYWLARGFITLSDILREQGQDFEADEYLKSLKGNYPGQESDIFEMIDTRLDR